MIVKRTRGQTPEAHGAIKTGKPMVIADKIKQFIEGAAFAFVATTDAAGLPHLAAGTDLKVQDGSCLLFENWFCATTLRNVAGNPNVAVAVTSADGQYGFQFLGKVAESVEEAVLDGYAPEIEQPELPQALIMFRVEVERVMEFSARRHTDRAVDQA